MWLLYLASIFSAMPPSFCSFQLIGAQWPCGKTAAIANSLRNSCFDSVTITTNRSVHEYSKWIAKTPHLHSWLCLEYVSYNAQCFGSAHSWLAFYFYRTYRVLTYARLYWTLLVSCLHQPFLRDMMLVNFTSDTLRFLFNTEAPKYRTKVWISVPDCNSHIEKEEKSISTAV